MENGIADIAHTALQRKELWRDAAREILVGKELCDVSAKLGSDLIDWSKWLDIITIVAIDNSDNLVRINLEHRTAYAVGRLIDRNLTAMRR